MSSSSANTVRLSLISFQSAGIYRCEVSNEFPDFDTVFKTKILSVVGRNTNSTGGFNSKVALQQFPLDHSYPQHLFSSLQGTQSTSTVPFEAPFLTPTFSGTSTRFLSPPSTALQGGLYLKMVQDFTSHHITMVAPMCRAVSVFESENSTCR